MSTQLTKETTMNDEEGVLKARLEDGSIKYWLAGHMSDAVTELAIQLIKEGLEKRTVSE